MEFFFKKSEDHQGGANGNKGNEIQEEVQLPDLTLEVSHSPDTGVSVSDMEFGFGVLLQPQQRTQFSPFLSSSVDSRMSAEPFAVATLDLAENIVLFEPDPPRNLRYDNNEGKLVEQPQFWPPASLNENNRETVVSPSSASTCSSNNSGPQQMTLFSPFTSLLEVPGMSAEQFAYASPDLAQNTPFQENFGSDLSRGNNEGILVQPQPQKLWPPIFSYSKNPDEIVVSSTGSSNNSLRGQTLPQGAKKFTKTGTGSPLKRVKEIVVTPSSFSESSSNNNIVDKTSRLRKVQKCNKRMQQGINPSKPKKVALHDVSMEDCLNNEGLAKRVRRAKNSKSFHECRKAKAEAADQILKLLSRCPRFWQILNENPVEMELFKTHFSCLLPSKDDGQEMKHKSVYVHEK